MLMSRELLIQCPDGQMKTVPLTGGRLSIGRSSAAELCFPQDAGLSRQHFAFEAEGDDDEVVVSPAGIAVNGELLPHTAPLDHDSEGRPLTHWPSGRYIAVHGTLWEIGRAHV